MSNERHNDRPMKLNEFLSQHAVFTVDELDRFLSLRGSGKPNTRKSLLTYYRKQGRTRRLTDRLRFHAFWHFLPCDRAATLTEIIERHSPPRP